MSNPTDAHRPRRRRGASFAAAALAAGVVLTGCASHPAAAPLKVKGTALPKTAGPVHPAEPAYRGADLAMYRTAARYFRWPVLVPQPPPAGARAAGATVSRFFAGSFTVDPHGRASQVPGSFVPGNPVAPAAYQLRLEYLGRKGIVTLFEAVHPYTPPKGAKAVALPGGLAGGRTWQSAPAPNAAPLRYVEGHTGGLYLMAYGVARHQSAAHLAAYFAHLRTVAVPAGKAPVATAGGHAKHKSGRPTRS